MRKKMAIAGTVLVGGGVPLVLWADTIGRSIYVALWGEPPSVVYSVVSPEMKRLLWLHGGLYLTGVFAAVIGVGLVLKALLARRAERSIRVPHPTVEGGREDQIR